MRVIFKKKKNRLYNFWKRWYNDKNKQKRRNSMKKVLITGGPTNEYIDEVMKITNMSSGKIAIDLAEQFINDDYETTLLLTKNIKNNNLDKLLSCDKFHLIRFETTDELLKAIENEAHNRTYDVVIHSSAVADYKPEYSFRMEDMANEISEFILDNARNINEDFNSKEIYDNIFEILTNPKCKVDDDTKISSVEPNLTVKLELTTKIITHLRELFPKSFICGFKLLENVSEEELIDAATKQIKKCKTDLCFANDLAELRKGNTTRLVITPHGYNKIQVDGGEGIFNLIKIATNL
jgi:phosphopantothenate-cysteine ligase